jgi:hypothetical protein
MLTETVKELLQENVLALGTGRPALRAAIQLTIILLDERHEPLTFWRAQLACEEILQRIKSAKVI